jgi:hypothetical protein
MLTELLNATIREYIDPDAQVERVQRAPMADHERGWSGAEVQRQRVTLNTGRSLTLMTKTMPLKERAVLVRLSRQGHANVPFTHTLDLSSPGPVLACMEDLAAPVEAPPPTS